MADFAENGKWERGLKIRRKQFHGGSIPPPGTIYSMAYVTPRPLKRG